MIYNFEDVSFLPQLDLNGYAKILLPLAINVEQSFGINRLIPIAQSAEESRNGNSKLARQGLNIFSIVATDSWNKQGLPSISFPTNEFIKGHEVMPTRAFRKYQSWTDSLNDWVHLITTLSVYKTAYALMKDNKIVEGVTEMGKVYATDPNYAKTVLDTLKQLQGQENA